MPGEAVICQRCAGLMKPFEAAVYEDGRFRGFFHIKCAWPKEDHDPSGETR